MASLSNPFETERLYFRLLDQRDLDAVRRQFSDQEMCRYLSEPEMDRKTAAETIAMVRNPDRDPYLRYGMFHRETGQFVGTCGYHHLDRNRNQVEIGYDIWRDFWRQGYASEALVPLLSICFSRLEVGIVYALIHRDNAGSIATASRTGFQPSEPCRPLDEPEQVCMVLKRKDWVRGAF